MDSQEHFWWALQKSRVLKFSITIFHQLIWQSELHLETTALNLQMWTQRALDYPSWFRLVSKLKTQNKLLLFILITAVRNMHLILHPSKILDLELKISQFLSHTLGPPYQQCVQSIFQFLRSQLPTINLLLLVFISVVRNPLIEVPMSQQWEFKLAQIIDSQEM